MIYNFHDYRQTPVRITKDITESDSPYIFPEPIASLINKASIALIEKHDKHIEKKLKQWIEAYPQVPMFKNLLSTNYVRKGKNEKAFENNQRLAQLHPDYIFSKLNLVGELLFRNEPDKAGAYFGDSPDIFSFTNNRQIFHVAEYVQYHKFLIRYWLVSGQTAHILDIYNNLEELQNVAEDYFDLYEINELLYEAGLKKHDNIEHKEIYVRTEPTLPQTTTPPAFHFQQIQWLYQNGFSIEKEKMEELLQLQRELLIDDLIEIVYDAIRRYNFFSEQEYDIETQSFPLHALYLLMELKAAAALPAVLELLRQPEKVLEYWMEDLLTDNIWQVVYSIGKDHLPLLEDFLKEPNNYTYGRTAVSTAISQLGMHEPARRHEVVQLYERLLQFYFKNQDNPAIADMDFLTLMIADIVDFNGTELTTLITQFYDEELVDLMMFRSLEECLEDLNTPDDQRIHSDKRPLQTVFEIRDELYKNEYLREPHESNRFSNYNPSPNLPVIRQEPKTGRNDPCPCGSGKKYKKCCGKEV